MEFLLIWIGFGVVTALAAAARGRSAGAWLVIGCLTGVFGLLAVLVMERQTGQGEGASHPLRWRDEDGDSKY